VAGEVLDLGRGAHVGVVVVEGMVAVVVDCTKQCIRVLGCWCRCTNNSNGSGFVVDLKPNGHGPALPGPCSRIPPPPNQAVKTYSPIPLASSRAQQCSPILTTRCGVSANLLPGPGIYSAPSPHALFRLCSET